MKTFEIDKKLLFDTMGRPLTQSLFLEIGYNIQYAVYSLDDEDKTYNGKLYPSLKKLYLEKEDPTEYEFAKAYLINWRHWKRLNENRILREYFDEWREELEVIIRSEAVRAIRDSITDGNFQSMKWLADRGWDKKDVGRPVKHNKEQEAKMRERIGADLDKDIDRMEKFDG